MQLEKAGHEIPEACLCAAEGPRALGRTRWPSSLSSYGGTRLHVLAPLDVPLSLAESVEMEESGAAAESGSSSSAESARRGAGRAPMPLAPPEAAAGADTS